MSTTQTPTLTLIGPGRHGTAIAGLFASHGVNISLFHYKPAKAEAAARRLRPIARNARIDIATSLEEAAQASPFLALTTLWGAPQQAVVSALGDLLDGKILIDVANPLDVTPTGAQMRRPVEGSAGQYLASLLPANVRHVKAFSNLATAAVASAAIAEASPKAVLPYLADSAETSAQVRPLLSQTGWQPRYVGTLRSARDLEITGTYNQVSGRLGRTVLDVDEFTARFGPEQTPDA